MRTREVKVENTRSHFITQLPPLIRPINSNHLSRGTCDKLLSNKQKKNSNHFLPQAVTCKKMWARWWPSTIVHFAHAS
jgi:hypothetical protein